MKLVKNRKRIGRGSGSGWGTTAGRGTKGQKSRTGSKIPARFQGGVLPLWQRLPKKSGIKPRSVKPIVLNLSKIEARFNDGETVSLQTLEEKKLITAQSVDKFGLKILASGRLTKKVKIDSNINLSAKAKKAYEVVK